MKLIDPTDEQLNAAFAEKVAGWVPYKSGRGGLLLPYTHFDGAGFPQVGFAPFTASADAVLPWLEQHYCEIEHWVGYAGERPSWRVSVEGPPTTNQSGQGQEKSLARSIVIALIRAHGCEVEFTK